MLDIKSRKNINSSIMNEDQIEELLIYESENCVLADYNKTNIIIRKQSYELNHRCV